jgi:hypothetical protein
VCQHGVCQRKLSQARETGDRKNSKIKILPLSSIAKTIFSNIPRADAWGFKLVPFSTAQLKKTFQKEHLVQIGG